MTFDELTSQLQEVIPDAVTGSFLLTHGHWQRVPPSTSELLRPYIGWSVFVFAVPITDDGLWVWHRHGSRRSLMAQFILRQGAELLIQRVERSGANAFDLPALVSERLSMSEIGALAGIGTRGWNNLLLHPKYGSWLQIHAIILTAAIRESATIDSSVCIHCSKCIAACPVSALQPEEFNAARCAAVVASPWRPRSRALALTASTYIECRECISSCPIGQAPEGILQWKR